MPMTLLQLFSRKMNILHCVFTSLDKIHRTGRDGSKYEPHPLQLQPDLTPFPPLDALCGAALEAHLETAAGAEF